VTPRTDSSEAIHAAATVVAGAERIVVLTGAGISTDSGIPDFRGPQGVWTKNPAAEKMATLQNYVAEPEVRQRAWQGRLRSEAWEARPNNGHHALVRLGATGRLHTLVTQNIDGLHQAAGSDPASVIEIHGTIREVTCLSCQDRAPMERALERVSAGEVDPECLKCGGILKSATISFGQGLIAADLERAFLASQQCDALIAIGSTLAVYPVAEMVPIAAQAGAKVVILNGEPTEMDRLADVVVRGAIGEALPEIVNPST